jgi:hypothetical protein
MGGRLRSLYARSVPTLQRPPALADVLEYAL